LYHPYYGPYNYNPDVYSDLDVRQGINRFYEHINGGGMSFIVVTGSDLEYVGEPWNDRISSVRVAPRTLVVLYEHRGFRGRIVQLINRSNSPHLWNLTHYGGDKTSSIKTFRLA
jgi:hypothetical protein